MRSKLFVPGARPELFAKALASQADALSFDLEDAVAAEHKARARQLVGDCIASAAEAGKTLIVRVNALDSPHFADDLRAVVRPGLQLVNLPKPESPAQVVAAAEALLQAERANGVGTPIGLLLNIETPAALRQAAALAQAHPRVAGLQMGLGDLFEPHGIDRGDALAVRQVMLLLKLAAAEAGVFAYDGAFAHIADATGYQAEAATARRLGFIGKSCIHPSQIALANAAFTPTAAEIAWARQVADSAAEAAAGGIGAWVVDGRMVDAPFVARARATLALAQRLGLAP